MAVAVTTGYSGHFVRFPGSLAANYPPLSPVLFISPFTLHKMFRDNIAIVFGGELTLTINNH